MMKLKDYLLQRRVNLLKEEVRENVERLEPTSIFGFERSYLPSGFAFFFFFWSKYLENLSVFLPFIRLEVVRRQC